MKELSWTPLDRAQAMVQSQRNAGRTVLPSFADEIAAAIWSEVEQRTKDLELKVERLVVALKQITQVEPDDDGEFVKYARAFDRVNEIAEKALQVPITLKHKPCGQALCTQCNDDGAGR